jgi:fused signal recognition particle receptor
MRLTKAVGDKPSFWKRIKDVALTDVGVLVRGLDHGSLEQIEEALLTADFGVPVTLRLVDKVESLSRGGTIKTEAEFHDAVAREIQDILESGTADRSLRMAESGPTVYLMVGVNGVGKTTSIGKLANRLRKQNRKVLLAAGDTFRAGAIDQLRVWSERSGTDFVGAKPGADPAAVAFDAIDAAVARGADVVIIDTAGRLHTQDDLMTELSKVERVIAKRLPGAPHETLLVLDATVGQNALSQARIFGKALNLSGLVLAKLDSTARGGIVVALKEELDLPVKLIGTGEQVDALSTFDPAQFSRDVLAS